MEELMENIQREQNKLIEEYFKENSLDKKEEIRKKLFLLCTQYIELGKNLKFDD